MPLAIISETLHVQNVLMGTCDVLIYPSMAVCGLAGDNLRAFW